MSEGRVAISDMTISLKALWAVATAAIAILASAAGAGIAYWKLMDRLEKVERFEDRFADPSRLLIDQKDKTMPQTAVNMCEEGRVVVGINFGTGTVKLYCGLLYKK